MQGAGCRGLGFRFSGVSGEEQGGSDSLSGKHVQSMSGPNVQSASPPTPLLFPDDQKGASENSKLIFSWNCVPLNSMLESHREEEQEEWAHLLLVGLALGLEAPGWGIGSMGRRVQGGRVSGIWVSGLRVSGLRSFEFRVCDRPFALTTARSGSGTLNTSTATCTPQLNPSGVPRS